MPSTTIRPCTRCATKQPPSAFAGGGLCARCRGGRVTPEREPWRMTIIRRVVADMRRLRVDPTETLVAIFDEMTHCEIAVVLGVSRARVGQIETTAAERYRRVAECRGLKMPSPTGSNQWGLNLNLSTLEIEA